MSELQAPRGTRDFMPQEKVKRDWIANAIRKEFEKFGFNPLETPALENFEVLSNKFAGGEEILKETYRLKDQGGRDLGLRYDLTVPLCRIIASNPSL
ncbi:MAG: ATP phosphoribosyltransferase regulatory subunit, partial [Candidatus Micrarchaeota archaeon]